MEHPNADLIHLIAAPCFCVREQVIVSRNAAAESLPLSVGDAVTPLLLTGAEEYAAFQEGALSLTLSLGGTVFAATVRREGDTDYFLLEQADWDQELTPLALAARELRGTLSGLCAVAESLSDRGAEEAPLLNRSLAQTLRIIGNMSAAPSPAHQPEFLDICALCGEFFEKAAAQLETVPRQLTYQLPKDPIYTLADPQELERALLNLLSNAAKFTSPQDRILCSLARRGRMLYLTVQDTGAGIPVIIEEDAGISLEDVIFCGAGIPEALRGSLFSRYQRQPAIEDGRFGLGLGLVLVRSAAAHHGGTVLVDSPKGIGTRVTMTLAIRQDIPKGFRSPILRVDYSGERDHGLVELSDVLPAECYREF